jgi:hypothetical protein
MRPVFVDHRFVVDHGSVAVDAFFDNHWFFYGSRPRRNLLDLPPITNSEHRRPMWAPKANAT